MQSFEAIQKAINGKTVEFAKRLGLSTSLINKWQEPSTDYTDSGAYNPLDRIEGVIQKSLEMGNPREDACAPIQYLNEKFDIIGIFMSKGSVELAEVSNELLKTITEFGHLSQEASLALADGKITAREYAKIEKEAWHLIRQVASFIQKAKEGISRK
jgi:transcriptional regulator with XRE-family HTH domain